MKSKGDTVLDVMLALLSDVQAAYPAARGLVLDKERLLSCYRNRGIEFVTLDLPSMDAHLLSLLETGDLPRSGFLMKRRSHRDHRPRFLHDLWSRIADSNGHLYKEPDPNALFFLRQIFCLGKKLSFDCTPARTEAARLEYHHIEARLLPPVLPWDEDDLGDLDREYRFRDSHMFPQYQRSLFDDSGEPDQGIGRFLERLDFISGVLVSELGYFSPLERGGARLDLYKHGPGAVSDARSSDFKFDFPHWPDKLEGQFPFDWCGASRIDQQERPSISEPPSRLLAVPKTAKAPRLIASEPVAHQWVQQWIKNEICERMKTCRLGKFISLTDQTLSQDMVRSSSVTRSLSTLDLSSASDRVTCRHVESLLRSNASLLRLCHAARTRWVVDDISSSKEYLRLRKFSAMGSALTFPMQSIFFLCVVLAACECDTVEDIDRLVGSVRVFGDDIIVPTTWYATTVSCLHHLGLVVNQAKSFSHGYFRESCGLDAYKGDDITPVKPRYLWCDGAEGFQSLVDTANNLHLAGCWFASRAVASIARLGRLRPSVVRSGSALPGLLTFSGSSVVAKRYDRNLQKWQGCCVGLVTKSKNITRNTSGAMLQFFVAPWSAERPRRSGTTSRPVSFLRQVRVDLELS